MPDSNIEYLDLITSEHWDKPKYVAYVRSFLDLASPIEDCLDDFVELFNIENAEGDQLDKLGQLFNISRYLPFNSIYVSSPLDDDTYRLVIKAKILKDHWDGTRKGMEEIMEAVFPGLIYDIVDNQNMTITITIVDPRITNEQEVLINQGYILPKPSGVGVTYSISRSALFGWDRNDSIVAGWGTGIWSST